MHVTMLLDSFEHHGLSGVHRCLVFDVMGPNSSAMLSYLPRALRPPREPSEYREGRLPFWMAKSVIKQTLLAVAFLHRNGIVHSDLQPGNILFSVKDLSTVRESGLAATGPDGDLFVKKINEDGEVEFQHIAASDKTDAETEYYTQRYIDGKPDPIAPRYIAATEPLFQHVNLDLPLLVKLTDLGGAFFVSEPPEIPATPLGLRGPELILGEPIGEAQDIGSFGCLMFEFLTGRHLFSVMPPIPADWATAAYSEDNSIDDALEKDREHVESSNEHHCIDNATRKDTVGQENIIAKEDDERHTSDSNDGFVPFTDASTDDDHVLQIATLLGPVPPAFMAKYPRSQIYFNDQGDVVKSYVEEPMEEDHVDYAWPLPPIETFFEREKGADVEKEEDVAAVKGLLRWMLRFEPGERPTAEMLLAHPWFGGGGC